MTLLKPIFLAVSALATLAAAERTISEEGLKSIDQAATLAVDELWKISANKETSIDFVVLVKALIASSSGEELEEDHDHDHEDEDDHEHRETFDMRSVEQLKKLDANKDFKLTYEEGCKGVKFMMSEQLTKLLSLDSDRDQKFSFKEYMLSVPSSKNNSEEENKKITKRVQSFFKAADTDKDDKISHSELIISRAPFYIESARQMQLTYRAPALDKNKNAQLDYDEVKGILPEWTKDGVPLPLNKIFADIHNLSEQDQVSLDLALNKL